MESLASDMSRSATTRAPVETSTFLFTDIEGSTRLWDDHVDEMGMALAQHDRLLRDAIEPSGGTVIKTTGDGMLAVFADPVAAVDAALAAQRNLRAATWGATGRAASSDGPPLGRRGGPRRRRFRPRFEPDIADPGHRPRRSDHLLSCHSRVGWGALAARRSR